MIKKSQVLLSISAHAEKILSATEYIRIHQVRQSI